MDARIRIPSQESSIGPVCAFTLNWCSQNGMNREDATEFTIALSELITDIILFAFPSNELRNFDLEFRSSLSHHELIVSELGEPFDPDKYIYDPKKAIEKGNFRGAGFRLIKAFCDDFIFINKGREGKEFRLVKKLKDHDIDRLLKLTMAKQDEIDKEISVLRQETEVEFEIREVSIEDSEDISKLIYRTYEYSYSKEDMYFPKQVEEAVLGKAKLGVITRTKSGEAVGYFAVLKKPNSNIGEVGEAVVTPEYRRRGLMSRMMKHLIRISNKYKLSGIFGKAVTNHPVSQKVNSKYGFKTTALLLAETGVLKFKGFDQNYPQHVSLVIDFLVLKQTETKNIYPPDKYLDYLKETYQHISVPVSFKKGTFSDKELASRSEIELVMNYSDATSLIIVHKFGRDFRNVLSDMVRSIEHQKGLATIYLDIPLQNPATPFQYKIIEELGFIYSGLLPFFYDEQDFLRIQKVYIELDLDLIDLYSDFAHKIKNWVSHEFH